MAYNGSGTGGPWFQGCTPLRGAKTASDCGQSMSNFKIDKWFLRAGCALTLAGYLSAVGTVASAADTTPADPMVSDDVNDPIEPVNRFIFQFNELIQTWFLRPAGIAYRSFLPPGMRDSIGNFLGNLSEPVTLANDLLQGEGTRAQNTVQRFAINSTYGIGGLFNRSDEMGVASHREDFGQTMAVWGAGEGFYLVLPVFGPSNPRDAIGKLGVDPFLDPWGYFLDKDITMTRTVLKGVDEYEGVMDELQQIKKTSIDYYAALRSMYRQKRAAEISNGEAVTLPPIPDLSIELEEPEATQPAANPDLANPREARLEDRQRIAGR